MAAKKTVLIFGTFDKLHPGHLYFIKQASRHGRVTAVVARDTTVRFLKKKKPADSERRRLARVARLPDVKRALLGDRNLDGRYRVLKKVRPDTICLGYDQVYFIDHLPKMLKRYGISARLIRLKPYKPQLYKSSKMTR